jgi:voltage-gated potassium channel
VIRRRYNRFIQEHEIAWELVMGALAAVFVTVGFSGDDASPESAPLIDAVEVTLTVIFLTEFVTRFAAAFDRRKYLRAHWIDLLALIPAVRGVRLLRLLRLLRLVRTFAGLYRALGHWQRIASHRGLLTLFIAWLGVAGICAIGLYLAEVGANESIRDPFDALWWAVVTLTTVGYGDVYPVTLEGRLAAGALMIIGITLFAGITGTITSYLVSTESAPTSNPTALLRELALLHREGVLTTSEFEAKKSDVLGRL